MPFARYQPSSGAPVRTRGRARGIAFLPVRGMRLTNSDAPHPIRGGAPGGDAPAPAAQPLLVGSGR